MEENLDMITISGVKDFPVIRLVTGASFGGSSVGSPLASTDHDVVVMYIDGIGKKEFSGLQWNHAIYNVRQRTGIHNFDVFNLSTIKKSILKVLFEELEKQTQYVHEIILI